MRGSCNDTINGDGQCSCAGNYGGTACETCVDNMFGASCGQSENCCLMYVGEFTHHFLQPVTVQIMECVMMGWMEMVAVLVYLVGKEMTVLPVRLFQFLKYNVSLNVMLQW